MNNSLPQTESSLATRLVLPFRILLAVLSIAGLLGWSYIMLFFLGYYGKAVFASPAAILFSFPYVFLVLSLYASFKTPPIKALLIMGIVLNTPLVALFINWLIRVEDYLSYNAFVPLAFVFAWIFLWITRWFVDRHISARMQAMTVAGVVGVLALSAAAVWPLTIDHRMEAQEFLGAAVNGNPLEARANFAASLQHAMLLRRKFERNEFLRQIAVAQAHLKLYDDANNTIKTYLENGMEERDNEELFRSIVREQILNNDYEKALETARPLNSLGRFQVQSLTLEAVSVAKAGKNTEARRILNVANTLANEQKDSNTRRYAFMHIAEAQAEIGWHDGALESAHKYGTEHLLSLLGSIGVKEAEAGQHESAKQTMQVIYRTVETAVANCFGHGTTSEHDRCLLKLVDELGDDRFFHLAGSVAHRINSISERDLAFRKISNFGAKYLNSDLEDLIMK